ncbi:polysaccharide lyase family 7 protein [Aquimarina sp. AU474]|uniref:polysaccharide lyase family 7 protein n=1 Tax=Aquimarina sp. AU474 TaxID=2108529 RepID=UPI000D69D809|nr:polysaccharide lyase family 7 protein [Aquimarina sp. AU474]
MINRKAFYRLVIHTLFAISISLILTNCSASEENTPEETSGEVPVEEEPEQEEEQQKNITWKNWYLSVPINRGNGKATSIYYEAIENNVLTENQKKYFYKNADGSYTFFTHFTGYTTSGESSLNGGKYCRTELREYWQGNQSTSDNWSMTTGTHVLESTLKVTYCEGRKQTYVAQIHGIKNDALGLKNSPATVKAQWYDGDLVIEYYQKPDSGEWTSDGDKKVTIGRVDNEKFTISLKIEGGKLLYKLVCVNKDIDTNYIMLYDYVGNGYQYENYFKTGNYFKWNSDYNQSAEVILYSAKTTHN